jgi:anti-sigma factor RsiW
MDPAGLAVAALLVVAPFARQIVSPTSGGGSAMVTEAVNDHVRLLQSQRPLEVESGGIHQAIPWFSGKLDFAPGIRFPGDAEFPLQGGAVGYFLDRKAATLVFGSPQNPIRSSCSRRMGCRGQGGSAQRSPARPRGAST